MARYHDGVCRVCRREGLKLFLKGERCYTDKCAIERRAYAPGQHGQRRKKTQEYGLQLREKQKIRSTYGILEKQFRRYIGMAERMKGVAGENLLVLLERRLDNTVYRMGFSVSRSEARQMVLHGHFLVNGRRVNVPSYLVKQGDEVSVAPASKTIDRILQSVESAERRGLAEWVNLDKKNLAAKMVSYPLREQLTMPMHEQMVIELYSKC